jgi:hypothetical protein
MIECAWRMQEFPCRQIGRLVCARFAVRMEWLLHCDLHYQFHLKCLNGQFVLYNIQLELAREQCTGT